MGRQQFRLSSSLRASIRIGLWAAAMTSSSLFAQGITGGVYGNLPVGKGIAAEVTNPATGYDSTVAADANGRYAVNGLMPGRYVVKLLRDGKVVDQRDVIVQAGSNSAAIFEATAGENVKQLNSVTVTAAQPTVNSIDVTTSQQIQTWSSTDVNRLPLLNADLLNVASMQSNVASITSSHGASPQFNGASGTENRYFINEFNVTDMQQGAVPDKIPNEALASVSTINGGMDAKYGSAMGGVVSGTIKQGSNVFQSGVDLAFTPATGTFNENGKNIYNYNGSLVTANELNHWSPSLVQDYWASGPIIPDKVFFYFLVENQPNNYGQGLQGVTPTTTYNGQYKTLTKEGNQQVLGNFTWNIATGHTLNIFFDHQYNNGTSSEYPLATPYDPSSASPTLQNWSGQTWRDLMLVANYHGQITDTLSVSAMTGTSQQYFTSYPQYGINIPYVQVQDPNNTNNTKTVSNGASSLYYNNYRMMGSRVDFTWDVTDNHEITFGGEQYSPTMAQANIPNPNSWTYSGCSTTLGPNEPCQINGQTINPLTGQPFAPGTKYVSLAYAPRIYYNSSPTYGFYLADTWHFAEDWTAYIGGRYDNYAMTDNINVKMYSKGNATPRLGVAWDVHGDSTLKIGASAGEYTEGIPLYFNAYGGTPGQGYIHTTNYYLYSGMGANSVPTGLTQVGTTQGSAGSGLHYLTPGQFIATSAQNAKLKQFQIYAQQKLGNNWVAGATLFTSDLTGLPNLDSNTQQMYAYLNSKGYPNAVLLGQYLITPGKDITIPVQLNGASSPLTMFTFPNSYIGYPSLHRRIYQFSLNMDHAYSDDEPYYLSASYTWRHEFGNTDGTTSYAASNNPPSNGVANTGATAYDGGLSAPGFLEGSSGNLADDIPSTFKAFGYYKFAHQDNFLRGLRVGGAFTYYAGGPVNCLSTYPQSGNLAVGSNQTGNVEAYYCNTLQNAVNGNPVSSTIIYPRGSYTRLPSYRQVDLDIGYDWNLGENAFSLDFKVLNLFNQQSITSYVNQMTNSNGQFNANFMQPGTFQLGRQAQLVFRWQFH
ncbi:TonB-dependent receptor [Dyella caseinilytica]|uniref:TonB-dependent receptor n=1 Tax=Dyella caseinilytica TaxID=1849581 RepID=A0ABX7GUQ2_9GAMM|nr:TonB-dependent receptor [Dyella caseinilytica]QRN53604.1 TonB-dependent receptor [Dyella caseinilytica]GFZ87844.1 Oar protein [Dyella caseinilytica]